MRGGRGGPRGAPSSEARLVVKVAAERLKLFDEVVRQRTPYAVRKRAFARGRGVSADDVEREPAQPVVIAAGMRDQILRDAVEPARSDGVEPRELERIEDLGGHSLGGPVPLVDPIVMKAGTKREAIAGGAQSAERRRVGS